LGEAIAIGLRTNASAPSANAWNAGAALPDAEVALMITIGVGCCCMIIRVAPMPSSFGM
jgi:hypothetical protein